DQALDLSSGRTGQQNKPGANNGYNNDRLSGRHGTAPEAAEHPPAHRFSLRCNRGNFKPAVASLLRSSRALVKLRLHSPYFGETAVQSAPIEAKRILVANIDIPGKTVDAGYVTIKSGGPSIGLVLGSGAARGFAHIGVMRALQAHGIKPDIIVGT